MPLTFVVAPFACGALCMVLIFLDEVLRVLSSFAREIWLVEKTLFMLNLTENENHAHKC